jgi:hypothetical protein
VKLNGIDLANVDFSFLRMINCMGFLFSSILSY